MDISCQVDKRCVCHTGNNEDDITGESYGDQSTGTVNAEEGSPGEKNGVDELGH